MHAAMLTPLVSMKAHTDASGSGRWPTSFGKPFNLGVALVCALVTIRR